MLDPEASGPLLLANARELDGKGDTLAAIGALSQLLDMPPNRASREAQAMIGHLWMKLPDPVRARREYELFLKLYPSGADAKEVAAKLAGLPAAPSTSTPVEDAPKKPATTMLGGSLGLYYYGGQSKIRSEDFKDSGLGACRSWCRTRRFRAPTRRCG